MQEIQKAPVIGEKLGVPAVSGPSVWPKQRSRFIVSCIRKLLFNIYPMPIHINRGYGKRDIVFLKFKHQVLIFVLCIRLIAAPPVTESKTRHQRHLARNFIKSIDRTYIIGAVCKHINIAFFREARSDFSVFTHKQRLAVIKYGSSVTRDNSVFERNRTVWLIKSACRAL